MRRTTDCAALHWATNAATWGPSDEGPMRRVDLVALVERARQAVREGTTSRSAPLVHALQDAVQPVPPAVSEILCEDLGDPGQDRRMCRQPAGNGHATARVPRAAARQVAARAALLVAIASNGRPQAAGYHLRSSAARTHQTPLDLSHTADHRAPYRLLDRPPAAQRRVVSRKTGPGPLETRRDSLGKFTPALAAIPMRGDEKVQSFCTDKSSGSM
jgi:hypothetical protein